jgi:hypothetical protein
MRCVQLEQVEAESIGTLCCLREGFDDAPNAIDV